MLCERCRQREANIRYTEIINGEVTEHHLCMECARSGDFGHRYTALFDGESQLGKLLSGLLGFAVDADSRDQSVPGRSSVCPVCHTSYADFVKESRFGCADCYEVFALLMGDHIRTLQGSDTHTGKRPMKSKGRVKADTGKQMEKKAENSSGNPAAEDHAAAERTEKIMQLELKLKEALREEEYELAAKYRDEIRALKTEEAAYE